MVWGNPQIKQLTLRAVKLNTLRLGRLSLLPVKVCLCLSQSAPKVQSAPMASGRGQPVKRLLLGETWLRQRHQRVTSDWAQTMLVWASESMLSSGARRNSHQMQIKNEKRKKITRYDNFCGHPGFISSRPLLLLSSPKHMLAKYYSSLMSV